MKISVITLSLLFALFLSSCSERETTFRMELQYVGQVCCGEFISVDSTRVLCGGIEDFLFHIVNLEEVGIEFGEEHLDEVFLLEFKLTDACEANCEISCNRYNGIPVEVISADK